MMNVEIKAAQAAAQAELCPNSAVVWIPCLLIEGEPLPCGIETSYFERVEGQHYDTPAQALAAATRAADQHPAAMGVSCLREVVEVCA